jgi:hypothetical protein
VTLRKRTVQLEVGCTDRRWAIVGHIDGRTLRASNVKVRFSLQGS